MTDPEPAAPILDAAAMSLAIFWPTRPPGMCAVGLLRSEEGPAVRAAAREVLIAGERLRGPICSLCGKVISADCRNCVHDHR